MTNLRRTLRIVLWPLCLLAALPSHAENSVYTELESLETLLSRFTAARTETGIDFRSKDSFENSKGQHESVVHMELEGPFDLPQVDSVDKAARLVVNMILREVDPDYETDEMVVPGVGLQYVDINGTIVAMIDYKISHETDTHAMRSVFLSDKGMYSYTIVSHQSEPGSRDGLYLVAVVTATINSQNFHPDTSG